MTTAAYVGFITAAITAFINSFLGFLVIKNDPKSMKNIFLFLFILVFGVGAQLDSVWVILAGQNMQMAITAYVFGMVPYASSFPLFYFFTRSYLGIKGDWHNVTIAIIASTITYVFAAFSPYTIFDLHYNQNLGYYTLGFSTFVLRFVVSLGVYLFVLSVYYFVRALQKETIPIEHNRLLYLTIGPSFSLIGVIAIIIPATHNFPWDMVGITITSLLLTYAVVKHQLLNITLVIRQSLIYTLISLSTIAFFIITGYILALFGIHTATLMPIQVLVGAFLISAIVQYLYLNQQKILKLLKEEQDLNTKIREMLLVTAHELRTPLTIISNSLYIVASEQGGSKLSKFDKQGLQHAAISTTKLINMVNNYMNASLIDAGKVSANIQAVNACEITQKVIKKARSNLSESQPVSIVTTCTGSHPLVKADPEKLETVLANLIDNAVKFTPQGTITIQHFLDGNQLITTISDTGLGIPQDKQQFLFKEMKQLSEDVMTRQVGGLGLGLFVSKKFVELMQGQLWLQSSEEGKGSSFAFSLPLAS